MTAYAASVYEAKASVDEAKANVYEGILSGDEAKENVFDDVERLSASDVVVIWSENQNEKEI